MCLRTAEDVPDVSLITGSEVELIYNAWDVLQEKGIDARVTQYAFTGDI